MKNRSQRHTIVLAMLLTAMSGTAFGADAIFSKAPIDLKNLPVSTTAFAAGDRIYCVLVADSSWKESLGRGTDYLMVYLAFDGVEKTNRTISLKRPEMLESKYVVLDIAPDVNKMTNYRDPDIIFDDKDGLKIGPEYYTKCLGELAPGKHTVRIEVKSYGKVHSGGEFTIDGADYSAYQKLHQQIKGGAANLVAFPKAGMKNAALEGQMRKLLANAGWKKILRLAITDKNWWNDLAEGGNSAVVGRHIAAAVAAKEGKDCFYAIVSFNQPKLISGAWGRLEMSRIGDKMPIPEKNIGR